MICEILVLPISKQGWQKACFLFYICWALIFNQFWSLYFLMFLMKFSYEVYQMILYGSYPLLKFEIFMLSPNSIWIFSFDSLLNFHSAFFKLKGSREQKRTNDQNDNFFYSPTTIIGRGHLVLFLSIHQYIGLIICSHVGYSS